MWFAALLKYSRMDVQFPRKDKAFQKRDGTLKAENEDFSL